MFGTVNAMSADLLNLALQTPAHTIAPEVLRAAARGADARTLAKIAGRLDLPADVTATIATHPAPSVAAAWRARPDIAIEAAMDVATAPVGHDPTANLTRSAHLSSLLTPTADPTTRAAVAARFAAKPTRSLALAWFKLDHHLVPVEIAPTVLELVGDRKTYDGQRVMSTWLKNLPFGTLAHLRNTRAYVVAAMSALGDDTDGTGADHLNAWSADLLSRLRADDNRGTNWYSEGEDLRDALIGWSLAGREVPEATAATLEAVQASHPGATFRSGAARTLSDWRCSGYPGWRTPFQAHRVPSPPSPHVPFPTIAELAATSDAHPLDQHPLVDLVSAAANSNRPVALDALFEWATTHPVTGDSDVKVAHARAEVAYALLTNPTIDSSRRPALVAAVGSYTSKSQSAFLHNEAKRSVAHVLSTLTDPQQQVELYLAGLGAHADRVPLTMFTSRPAARHHHGRDHPEPQGRPRQQHQRPAPLHQRPDRQPRPGRRSHGCAALVGRAPADQQRRAKDRDDVRRSEPAHVLPDRTRRRHRRGLRHKLGNGRSVPDHLRPGLPPRCHRRRRPARVGRSPAPRGLNPRPGMR